VENAIRSQKVDAAPARRPADCPPGQSYSCRSTRWDGSPIPEHCASIVKVGQRLPTTPNRSHGGPPARASSRHRRERPSISHAADRSGSVVVSTTTPDQRRRVPRSSTGLISGGMANTTPENSKIPVSTDDHDDEQRDFGFEPRSVSPAWAREHRPPRKRRRCNVEGAWLVAVWHNEPRFSTFFSRSATTRGRRGKGERSVRRGPRRVGGRASFDEAPRQAAARGPGGDERLDDGPCQRSRHQASSVARSGPRSDGRPRYNKSSATVDGGPSVGLCRPAQIPDTKSDRHAQRGTSKMEEEGSSASGRGTTRSPRHHAVIRESVAEVVRTWLRRCGVVG